MCQNSFHFPKAFHSESKQAALSSPSSGCNFLMSVSIDSITLRARGDSLSSFKLLTNAPFEKVACGEVINERTVMLM